MIRGIAELSSTTVKEVMVPRIDVVFISLDFSVHEVLETIASCGHSRFPVFKTTIDNVVGILYAKDVLRAIVKKEDLQIDEIMRSPYFVPESKRIDSLLREFKSKHVHIAVAVDEFGGVSGIVCFEDIIEEIVGDIQDEFDNEQEDILQVGKGMYLCDARVGIEDLNEKISLEIPQDEYDTLGGFVFGLFGKIPAKYEKVGYNNLDFVIQSMEGHKIQTVKIIIHEQTNQDT
ncbi:MAG: hemolysin family protein [Spirochaetales bacterium]|nr:hemolysin family protein [Spirochaetales bacterium]